MAPKNDGHSLSRRGFLRRSAMAASAGMLAACAVPVAPGVSAAAESVQPSVTPIAGAPGTRFTFVAAGFGGDRHANDDKNSAELVTFWISTPDGRAIRALREDVDDLDEPYASAARADRSGTVEYTWRAPMDAPVGAYTLVAHGNKSGREVVIAFEIQTYDNEAIVRHAYHTAEGSVLDVAGFVGLFANDGVINLGHAGIEPLGLESYRGEQLGDLVLSIAKYYPDVHRELHRVNVLGDMVAVELSIQGTFLGPLETPAGIVQPTGAKVDGPCADFWYLRDGKIERFDCYIMLDTMRAQMGVK